MVVFGYDLDYIKEGTLKMTIEDIDIKNLPEHIAIIMDGNRRWAKENGLETRDGHKAGADNLEKISKYANKIGIKYLTVYAFSTENWKRTQEEVGALMFILKGYIEKLLRSVDNDNIVIKVLGDISKLDKGLQDGINRLLDKTKNNTGLILNIAFNYGGRDEIVKAVKSISKNISDGTLILEDIDEKLVSKRLYTCGQPDPDILIRPGGEIRLSNFLLWQTAYTELIFLDKYWPDFSEEDLLETIKVFQNRIRKFGS